MPVHCAKKALAAQVVVDLIKRVGLDPALLENVILGCAYPEAAQGNNLARIVGLLAGLPHEVGGMTVNRFCGSSMQAVHIAAAQIEASKASARIHDSEHARNFLDCVKSRKRPSCDIEFGHRATTAPGRCTGLARF